MIVKKCLKCGDYFKPTPFSFRPYCNKEECQKSYTRSLIKVINTRSIPIEWFDLYDTNYFYKDSKTIYQRVCRVCGSQLKTKKGNYSVNQRNCKKHSNTNIGYLNVNFTWSFIRNSYLFELWKSNLPTIKSLMKDAGIDEIYYRNYVNCELCGKLSKMTNFQVHHIKPVHTLEPTEEGIMDIFDSDNLIGLCLDCHHKQDHQLGRTEEEKELLLQKKKNSFFKQYKTIDKFMS